MTPTEPLQLHHSWPLTDIAAQFDLGHLHDDGWDLPAVDVAAGGTAGRWSCDLVDNALFWSPQVHRLFGLPTAAGAPPRNAAVAMYDERSRAAMERLRAHAIRHRRGFTLDIEIVPIGERRRWLRLVAAPVSEGGRVVRLHGTKTDVSDQYRRR